jgi:hypothetical protein
MRTSRHLRTLALLVIVVMALPGSARAADRTLAREMRRSVVAVVPPENVHTRGESKAHIKHRPLEAYDSRTYPDLFGELAEKMLRRGPTRWDVQVVRPATRFYRAVETSDPDGDPAAALPNIPEDAAGAAYVAVFRYAEFAYSVDQIPRWTRDGRVYMQNVVVLALDLQLVVYDGASGEPLDTFDALYEVEVPEIQAKPIKTKAFHRATRGALSRMRKAVARGKTAESE